MLTGIEPVTSSVTGKRSFRLSYSTVRAVESVHTPPGQRVDAPSSTTMPRPGPPPPLHRDGTRPR